MTYSDAGSEMQRWAADNGFGPRWKIFSVPAAREYRLKKFYTISRKTVYQLHGDLVNLHNRQIGILPRTTKAYATYREAEPPSGPPGSRYLYRLILPLVGTGAKWCTCNISRFWNVRVLNQTTRILQKQDRTKQNLCSFYSFSLRFN